MSQRKVKQDPNFRVSRGEVRRTNCALKFLVARPADLHQPLHSDFLAHHVYLFLMCRSLLERQRQAVLLLSVSKFRLRFSRKGELVGPRKNRPAKAGAERDNRREGLREGISYCYSKLEIGICKSHDSNPPTLQNDSR